MKKLLIGVLLVCWLGQAAAQSEGARKKIENAKIALITKRLDLNPEQAQKFWPIYNEFEKRNREIRKAYSQARKQHDPQTASEEENQRLLQLGMETKKQALQLEQHYSDRLLTIISSRQLMSLRKAESDFKKMLLERIQNRQQMRKRRQGMNNRRGQ